VSCATPPLLAEYPGTRPPPKNESIDAVFTIAPFDAASLGRAIVHARHRPCQIDREHALEHGDVVLVAAPEKCPRS
jgi:hypothetical protein